MVEQSGLPSWIIELGAVGSSIGTLFAFVLNRHDKAMTSIQRIDKHVMQTLAEHAETAERRQEAVRRELTESVNRVNARIDDMSQDMAKSTEVRALSARIDSVLAQRTRG